MPFYSAYNLIISSEVQLPAFREINTPDTVDVEIVNQEIILRPGRDEIQSGCFYSTGNNAYFHWNAYGTYLIQDGSRIHIDLSDAQYTLPHIPLTGVLMGVLLNQRGLFTLHASAIQIGENAVLFMGYKGAGKSTTAAGLYSYGYALAADDVVPITWQHEMPYAIPSGYTLMRVSPDVVTTLHYNTDSLKRIHPELEKRELPLADEKVVMLKTPVSRIYILQDSDNGTYGATRLSKSETFYSFLSHSYAQRFLGDAGGTKRHFRQCERLVNSVPVYSLSRPRSLDKLPELITFIENHTL